MTEGQEMYLALRDMARSMTPKTLGLSDEPDVYGLIMDQQVDRDRWFTLAAFASGDTSLYFSTGGGIIGASRHDPVRKAALALVATAAAIPRDKLQTGAAALPGDRDLQFHFLTKTGTYHISGTEAEARTEAHMLHRPLFAASHLISEIRLNADG